MTEENPQQEKKKQGGGIIRTYEGDISDAVKFKKASIAGIAVAEQKRREESEIDFTEEKKENYFQKFLNKKTLIIVGSILLFVIALIIIILSLTGSNDTENVEILPTQTEIIFSNKTKDINITGLDRDTIVSKILEERRTNDSQLGSITNLLITTEIDGTTKISTANEFLNLLEIKLPTSLTKYTENEFMFGIHSVRNIEPFLIFRISSFENAFTGMLEWEKNMENDLSQIFIESSNKTTAGIDIDSTIANGTTTSESVITIKKTFEDIVIKNKDTRVLNDQKGNPKLMYSFPDRKTILITTNQYTMIEVLDRLDRVRFGK